jgi:acyl carrier protein
MSSETMSALKNIFCDYFDEDLVIERSTSAKDIDDWDSLAQVGLVLTIEKVFGFRLAKNEIDLLQNIGDMADLIDEKK